MHVNIGLSVFQFIHVYHGTVDKTLFVTCDMLIALQFAVLYKWMVPKRGTTHNTHLLFSAACILDSI